MEIPLLRRHWRMRRGEQLRHGSQATNDTERWKKSREQRRPASLGSGRFKERSRSGSERGGRGESTDTLRMWLDVTGDTVCCLNRRGLGRNEGDGRIPADPSRQPAGMAGEKEGQFWGLDWRRRQLIELSGLQMGHTATALMCEH